MAYRVSAITLFPDLFQPFFVQGLLGQAVQKGLIETQLVNPREFTQDVHKTVDDRPYGGGDGMVMLAEPLAQAVAKAKGFSRGPVIYLSPQGQTLTHGMAQQLSAEPGMILVCGRYGGVDERFIAQHVDREISVGDYVLNGGEVGALAILEAVSRLIPGVLGNAQSAISDSFVDGLLEAPQMTRPPVFEGLAVPEVLTSGNHKKIAQWRRQMSILRTFFRRPELLKGVPEAEIREAQVLYRGLSDSEKSSCGLPLES